MSHIFDALRRVDQMNGGPVAEPTPFQPGRGLDVLQSFAPKVAGLETVERVVGHPQRGSRVLSDGERDRAGVERFKLLRYRLYQLRKQRSVKCLLIASSIPQEGKSTVAANLAVTLAQVSGRVLLVDADLRKPSLHTAFGLKPMRGLADVLQERAEFIDACRRASPWGIYFLGAGSSVANPVELLQAEAMQCFMHNVTTLFDWVLLDSPPLVPLADGRFLASLCDAAVFVAREGYTRREQLEEGLAALKAAYCAGIVLNSSQSADQAAYSYYHAPAAK